MKPSERIKQLNKVNSQGDVLVTDSSAVKAILEYLDEKHETNP